MASHIGSEEPEVTEAPEGDEASMISEISEASEVSETLDAPLTSEVLDASRTTEEPVASKVAEVSEMPEEPQAPEALNPPESLDIDEKLSETVEARRRLSGAKGAFAKSILANQNSAGGSASFLGNSQTGFHSSSGIFNAAPADVNTSFYIASQINADASAEAAFLHAHSSFVQGTSSSATTFLPEILWDAYNGDSLPPGDLRKLLDAVDGENNTQLSPNQPLASTFTNCNTTEMMTETTVNHEKVQFPSNSLHEPSGVASADRFMMEISESEWPEEMRMVLEDEKSPKFDAVERWFNQLQAPTMEDAIKYKAAKLEEDRRKARMENQKSLDALQAQNENEVLFCSVEDLQASESSEQVPQEEKNECPQEAQTGQPSTTRRRKQNQISAQEKKDSMQLGLDVALGRVKKSAKPRKRKAKGDDRPGPAKRSKGKNKQSDEILESLLTPSVIEDARENSSLPEIPGFTKSNKDHALAEILATIPSEDQKEAKSDKRKLLEASRVFSPSAKSDGEGGWKVDGLQSSLYHHQLQGAASMRNREASSRPPFGGLLCDTMGFGKTIQALANIIDGRATDLTDPVKTNLIVVPSNLVEQWRIQILKHCNKKLIGRVLVYRSSSRLDTLNVLEDLQLYNIIITTYEEIRRSYPRPTPINQVVDEEEITEWWHTLYENEAGPLHRLKFRRIILDEGHIIKNHHSQVSIAVRALTGHFKWVLTGTPVPNYIEEFYPLFNFLGVQGSNSAEIFAQNYCKNETARQRLVNLLRSFMIRRTHSSRLFSLPIIKLPEIEEKNVITEFCGAERAIYEAIVEIFFNNINGLASVHNPEQAQYRCLLAMMQKLRMICSHVLTTQRMVKKLLSGPLLGDLSRIGKSCKSREEPSFKIVTWLIALKKNPPPRPKNTQPEDPGASVIDLPEDTSGLVQRFHRLMCQLHENGQWEERLERTNCPRCGLLPENTVITSCMHLYCKECYCFLKENSSDSTTAKPICVKCNAPIQEAAKGDSVEDMNLDETELPRSNKRDKDTRRSKISRIAGLSPDDEDEDEDSKKKKPDWIDICAQHMPSAKLTKIREIVSGWIKENPDTKVVIFTQFLDFVRILALMCKKEKWPHVQLTGNMRQQARDESMKSFAENKSTKVLLATLRTGGIGLDMTMANKCILVDLWWNEAIQEQAFCRLFRMGQKRQVEFVKIIVRESIDDYMLQIQTQKTADINETIGDDNLNKRDTTVSLLRLFGDVTTTEGGGVIVQRHKGKPQNAFSAMITRDRQAKMKNTKKK